MVESLLKRLIYLGLRIKIWKHLSMKVRKIKGNIKINNVQKNLKNKHLKYWKSIDNLHSSDWLTIYYSINGIADFRYISEQTYYSVVEPKLNHISFSEAYSDKNNYSRFLNDDYFPKTYLRLIDGVFYTDTYDFIEEPIVYLKRILERGKKIVCKKAIESGGGRGVSILEIQNGNIIDENGDDFDLSLFIQKLGRNIIVQEYIEQHTFFESFNPSSVNTIRIFTYRSVISNEIHILQSVMRIGEPGAIVDNQASGGTSVGVNPQGMLNKFGVSKYGSKFLNKNNITFEGKTVPQFLKICDVAIECARFFPYHRLLGLDFSVLYDGSIKLIEVNNKNNEINFYQMNNGPLFGEFTDEIIDYCRINPTHINLDFDI